VQRASPLPYPSYPLRGADRLVVGLEEGEHPVPHHSPVRHSVAEAELVDQAQNKVLGFGGLDEDKGQQGKTEEPEPQTPGSPERGPGELDRTNIN
jgi:hypothetical protein